MSTIRIEYMDGQTEDVYYSSMSLNAGAVSFYTSGGDLTIPLHNIRRYYEVSDIGNQSCSAAESKNAA